MPGEERKLHEEQLETKDTGTCEKREIKEERNREDGEEWSERTGGTGEKRRVGERKRQRSILAGYIQYELLPKNIKNLLACGQSRLNTNRGPHARRIAGRIIGRYCWPYKPVHEFCVFVHIFFT